MPVTNGAYQHSHVREQGRQLGQRRRALPGA